MIQKYIIDKADIHNLLTGKEIPLGQGSKARAFCVEIAGGMTNGEVLKSIFPTAELILGNSDHMPDVLCVKEKWWNAPYKAESEEYRYANIYNPNDLTFMFDGVTKVTDEMIEQMKQGK